MSNELSPKLRQIILYFIKKGYVINHVGDYFYFTDSTGMRVFKVSEFCFKLLHEDWFRYLDNESS
jgi:hypothetical protein